MLFRIPIKLHKPKAVTKARIHYFMQPVDGFANRYRVLPAPGATFFEIDADSIAAATRKLQELVLPGDPRLIQGRTNVCYFRVHDKIMV
jgi:hypothetical protein